ncbi:MAG: hypothetical protein AYP45_12605 [Candidatus Brocadia carolinensis]|uniref:Lipopolysaccharide heptosyltransferase II n=1 Tax=Candidatus Brocadia carolinensis TaxID=1004156 RepID=A0A1V4ARR5_9BACT|nr:MAG: hypothetical protein AYP45_12605 [Candidatus Brocadia caroliniensis]
MPTLGAIRNHFPNAFIEVMGYPAYLELIKGRYYADVVSRFDQMDIAHLFVKDAEIPNSFKERLHQMDLIISFVSDRDQIFSHNLNASKARCIIHYDSFPADDEGIHMIDHFLQLLDSLEITYTDTIPKIFLNDEDIRFGEDFVKDCGTGSKKMLIAIHPGSGSKQKCWSIERFATLISRLNQELQAHIIVVSGPADQEIIERLKAEIHDDFTLVDQLPLAKLAAVIKRCNIFIGNDSGITHLAAALGIRTIALFGPTDPKMWGPRGESVKILYNKVHCSPCVADVRRNCITPICLESIKMEDIIHEVLLKG